MAYQKARHFSYAEQKQRRNKAFRGVWALTLIALIFFLAQRLFVINIVVESESMRPNLAPGQRAIVSPIVYGIRNPFKQGWLLRFNGPKRGDVILMYNPSAKAGAKRHPLNAISRFFSFQRVDIVQEGKARVYEGPILKRVVAVPGDSVLMEDYIVRVRPAGSRYFLSEFELARKDYDLQKAQLPKGWQTTMPFSGHMDEIHLESDDYFVLSDRRVNANDSRSFGPVRMHDIIGRYVLGYWPTR